MADQQMVKEARWRLRPILYALGISNFYKKYSYCVSLVAIQMYAQNLSDPLEAAKCVAQANSWDVTTVMGHLRYAIRKMYKKAPDKLLAIPGVNGNRLRMTPVMIYIKERLTLSMQNQ